MKVSEIVNELDLIDCLIMDGDQYCLESSNDRQIIGVPLDHMTSVKDVLLRYKDLLLGREVK